MVSLISLSLIVLGLGYVLYLFVDTITGLDKE